MSSTIQQDFAASVELRSIVRSGNCRVGLKLPRLAPAMRSELMYFLHNRFRLSVRVRKPCSRGTAAGLPFSDMSTPFHTRAGIAIYNWMSASGVPSRSVRHSPEGAAAPKTI